MQSVEYKILASIKKRGRGAIVFPSNFVSLGSAAAVRKALCALVADGTLLRLANGIYLYPQTNKYLNVPVLPSLDEIAEAIAKRDRVHIQPVASYAMNLLGLSTQMPQNAVYLTDGAARSVNVYGGRGIKFIRTTPKNLLFRNPLVGMVVSAIKEIGNGNVTEEEFNKIQSILLSKTEKTAVAGELVLAPIWVREMILKMYE